MLEEFREYDQKVLHDTYRARVEELERLPMFTRQILEQTG